MICASTGLTGKERDNETAGGVNPGGLDYFGARYYAAAQGRFTSPDQPVIDQNALDPQSWNLYSYARNNPLRFVDPTGNAVCSYGDGPVPEGRTASTEKECTESGGKWINQATDTDDPNADASSFHFFISKTEFTDDLSASGQVVVNQLAKNADPSMALIGTVAVTATALGTGAALAPVAGQAINEIAFGPAVNRLFWAGGAAAANAARASGAGRVIGESRVGALYARLTGSLPWAWQRPGWLVLSRFWASGAAGTVTVFPRSPNPSSLLYTVELPTLLNNPNVFKLLQYR